MQLESENVSTFLQHFAADGVSQFISLFHKWAANDYTTTIWSYSSRS